MSFFPYMTKVLSVRYYLRTALMMLKLLYLRRTSSTSTSTRTHSGKIHLVDCLTVVICRRSRRTIQTRCFHAHFSSIISTIPKFHCRQNLECCRGLVAGILGTSLVGRHYVITVVYSVQDRESQQKEKNIVQRTFKIG